MFDTPLPRDAHSDAKGEPLGNLPEWDLTDLYAADDAPELIRDLEWLECVFRGMVGTDFI